MQICAFCTSKSCSPEPDKWIILYSPPPPMHAVHVCLWSLCMVIGPHTEPTTIFRGPIGDPSIATSLDVFLGRPSPEHMEGPGLLKVKKKKKGCVSWFLCFLCFLALLFICFSVVQYICLFYGLKKKNVCGFRKQIFVFLSLSTCKVLAFCCKPALWSSYLFFLSHACLDLLFR